MRLPKRIVYKKVLWLTSLIAYMMIKVFSFKIIVGFLTNSNEATSMVLSPSQTNILIYTKLYLVEISKQAPWRVLCYEQAIVILIVAKILKVNVNLCFGIRRDDKNNLLAHAWTTVNDQHLTGGENAHLYTLVYSKGYQAKTVS